MESAGGAPSIKEVIPPWFIIISPHNHVIPINLKDNST